MLLGTSRGHIWEQFGNLGILWESNGNNQNGEGTIIDVGSSWPINGACHKNTFTNYGFTHARLMAPTMQSH